MSASGFNNWLGKATSLKSTMASLSLYEKLQLIISSLGLVSLIFIYLQTSATSESLAVSAYQSISAQTLELDQIFIQRPYLRPYFYSGAPINENDDRYAEVMSVAEFQLDFFDSALSQLDHMPRDKRLDRNAWDKYISDSFANSPALCMRFKRNPNWYKADFVEKALKACK